MDTYHIFLSFSCGDIRKNFKDHLYTTFCNAGFHTFRFDDHEIQRIEHQVEKTIQESMMSVIVFSREYGSSKWCLDELVRIIQRRNSDDSYRVFPIFYNVEPTEVRYQKGSFKEAFDKYEESGEHSKEKIDQWRDALKEVSKIKGKVLQDEYKGHEAEFIQTIVKDVGAILKRAVLVVASYTVGVESRVKDIDLWLKDPADVGIGVICGMGGIGKTTIAKVAYNLNFSDFETCSFIANVREASNEQNGLLHLQNQLLSDICKGQKQKIYNSDENIVKIQNALCTKKVLVILDDVDKIEHVDALIGVGDSFLNGSKIIITTRERLPCLQNHKTFRIKELDDQESLQLFCWHAFSEDCPMEGYLELSERVIQYCEGLPLTLQVMGSSLFGRKADFWASALENLEAIADEQVCKIVEMSYKSLHEDHEKQLFLMIAWSYVGEDIDDAVKLLEEYDFYSKVGMQKLMDKYLIRVDNDNKVVMHPLVHGMAMAIIRQETIDSPEKHDFYNSIGAKSETVTCERSLLYKNDNCGKRKHLEDSEDESMPTNEERSNSFKRLCLGFFSLFEHATRITKLLTRRQW